MPRPAVQVSANTREIGDAVGLRSASSVSEHLKSSQERGFLRRSRTVSRPIDVRIFVRAPMRREAAEDSVAVPVVGDIAAGAAILAEEHADDMMTLPRELLGRGTVFGLRARGDSMIDAEQYRAVATRDDKTAVSYRGMLDLTTLLIWL
ncbi:hypothetical protein IU427_33680 [Nocardia beijingensis]|nr:hypothetical protein [Nocardia beijingensis]